MVTVPSLYPHAEARILYDNDSTPLIDTAHLQLCFHTMGGYLRGTEAQWKTNGAFGVRSHFGLGGARDAPVDDGKLLQWNSLSRVAYAQNGGNPYCISVETSDGAVNGLPWSSKQLDRIVELIVWFTKLCKLPKPKLASAPGEYGTITYHQQFKIFNVHNHDCPGSNRLDQLLHLAMPRAIKQFSTHTEDEVANTPQELKDAAYAALQQWATERHDVQAPGDPADTFREVLDAFPELQQAVSSLTTELAVTKDLVQKILLKVDVPPPGPING